MKKRIRLVLLALVLFAVMLQPVIPTVNATITEDEYGITCFETFADLKKLCAKSYTEWTKIKYNGTSASFVISQNLTIPENLSLDFTNTGTTVTINKGITVNANYASSTICADSLVINGNLNTGGYNLEIYEKLAVNGTIKLSGNIMLWAGTTLTGSDNIKKVNEASRVFYNYNVYDESALKTALDTASADTRDIDYDIFTIIYEGDTLRLTKSMKVAANTKLSIMGGVTNGGTFIINSGVKLTNNGSIRSSLATKVYGTLVNNTEVYFDSYGLCKMSFADASCYRGNGKLYVGQYQLSAYKNGVTGLNWDIMDVTDNGWYWIIQDAPVLNRPVVTLGNVASTGKIKISWAEVPGAVKYQVYRSTDNQTWGRLITTTDTSIINAKTDPGVTYYYKVRAIASNSSNNSAFSSVKSRMCDLPRPTVTLSNVASTGKVKISWTAVEGAVKYQIQRSLDNKTWEHLAYATGTSATNTKTEAGVTYYYKVRAIAENSSANSAYSSVKSRMCDLAQPILSISLNSSGKPKLSWTKVNGAVKYQVYRSTDNKTWEHLAYVTSTSATNTKAIAGTKYYYKVRAIAENTAANSAYSAVKAVTSK